MAASSQRPSPDFVECSREQQGLWLLEQTRAIGAANNVPVGATLSGRLDLEALERAVQLLVESEPALSTQFAVLDGRLVRAIGIPQCPLPTVDVVEAENEQVAAVIAGDLSARPLDPLQSRPFEATLIASHPQQYQLLLVFHHCMLDGASAEPLLEALVAHYAAIVTCAPPPRPSDANGFDRFVNDEQRLIREFHDRARAYWEPTLAAVETSLRLPTVQAEERSTDETVIVDFELTGDLKLGLERVGKARGASLFVTLLAALQAVQWRYAGGGDEGVATAMAMDTRPRDVRRTIGMYANEAPLFSTPHAGQRFCDLLEEVQQGVRSLYELRRYPFTEALARFTSGSSRREAAAELGVTYLRRGNRTFALPELAVRPLGILTNRSSRRPLMLWLFDEPGRVRCRLEVDARAVEPKLAQGITRHYSRLLDAVAADPAVEHASVPALTPVEREAIVRRWSGAAGPGTSESSLAGMVEREALHRPAVTAVESDAGSLSYADLEHQASELARRLRALGAGPDVPVGIFLDRSAELVVAMLATLKAGAAYLPIDPSYPGDRIRVMLEVAKPPIVVTQRRKRDGLPSTRARLVLLDSDGPPLADATTDLQRPTGADHLAYVIFTSGSTGVPKAVAMPQRPLINLLEWQRKRFALQGSIRTLQYASVSFDVAFQEIFSTLVTGGTLILVDEESRSDFDRLVQLLRDRSVERLFLPFLGLNALARAMPRSECPTRKMEVITAGERLEITPDIREMFRLRPNWTLTNQYGPAETHVVTEYRLGRNTTEWPNLPPIGRPIHGARAFVLDQQRRMLPVGVQGELYLGGVCLARGYLGQATLTAERFVPNPFEPPGGRLYRTGDLVRWRGDGLLEFLGRLDDQVKIRGYRVEPGEIQARLVDHPGVREAAVIAREEALVGRRLVAYIVAEEDSVPTRDELASHLAQLLPDFMVPRAFVQVDALPTTPNGKLDRHRLPAPSAGDDGRYRSPRTDLETLIADVWAGALGLGRVGIDDDFFRLGGHSLLAGEVVARIRGALEREIPLRILFTNPTVAGLAAALDAEESFQGVDAPIPRAERRRLADLVSDEEIVRD